MLSTSSRASSLGCRWPSSLDAPRQCALRRRDQWGIFELLEGLDVKKGIGSLLEQSLTVILSRKAFREPMRQARRLPAVEMEDWPLSQIVTHAIPVERRFPPDMQPFKPTLQQDQARV